MVRVGPMAARDLIDNTQLVINAWLIHWGFSIGVGDTVADEATMFELLVSSMRKRIKQSL